MRKVGIVAECVCDLPKDLIYKYDIDIVYFLVETDNGIFTDTVEITPENILEYMESGGEKSLSFAPSPQAYREAFEKKLKMYEEVILVTISRHLSNSYRNANEAADIINKEGKRVYVIDSQQLSTGVGHMVLYAGEYAREGMTAEEIIPLLDEMKDRIVTSFITQNADFLYRNNRVSKRVKKICDIFKIHPVLAMKKGKLALDSVRFGNYEKAYGRYIKKLLKNIKQIDSKRAFITYVGCSIRMLDHIKRKVNKSCAFQELIVTKASATISCNCGAGTFGLLIIKKNKKDR